MVGIHYFSGVLVLRFVVGLSAGFDRCMGDVGSLRVANVFGCGWMDIWGLLPPFSGGFTLLCWGVSVSCR